MEFFIPSLLLFLIAMVISFALAPNLSPIILAVLSIALLVFGVYHHYNMFASEYRLSTWQESLKIYAPAIMIGAIILYIMYSIFGFFSSGYVPLPQIPKLEVPELPSVTNTFNTTKTAVSNAVNTVKNQLSNVTSGIANTVGDITDTVSNTLNNTTKNINQSKNRNNISRSLLEVL